jgi:alpha-beta hydrolase superfamily lysophospholipase
VSAADPSAPTPSGAARLLRWLLRAGIGLGSLYGLIGAVARYNYRIFVYPGAARVAAAATQEQGVEHLRLTASDGATVNALWLSPAGAQRLVVYFHGNGNIAEDQLPLARQLVGRGLAALLVEYRGYGASSGGIPSEQGFYLDAEAALDEAARRGFSKEHVALWGASLGTGIAAEMAARGRGSRLVLISPFTSLTNAARAHAPWWLPVSLVLPDRFDTLGKAHRILIPTLVVHGDADEVIPFEQGVAVAKAIGRTAEGNGRNETVGRTAEGNGRNETVGRTAEGSGRNDTVGRTRFLPLAGAHHNDVYEVGGEALFDAIVDLCSG